MTRTELDKTDHLISRRTAIAAPISKPSTIGIAAIVILVGEFGFDISIVEVPRYDSHINSPKLCAISRQNDNQKLLQVSMHNG